MAEEASSAAAASEYDDWKRSVGRPRLAWRLKIGRLLTSVVAGKRHSVNFVLRLYFSFFPSGGMGVVMEGSV